MCLCTETVQIEGKVSLGVPENKGCQKEVVLEKRRGPKQKKVTFLARGKILEVGEILEIREL